MEEGKDKKAGCGLDVLRVLQVPGGVGNEQWGMEFKLSLNSSQLPYARKDDASKYPSKNTDDRNGTIG